MKITLNHPYPLLHPNPVVIVGTKNDEGVNFTTIGDVAVAGLNPALVMISLHEKHLATKNIRESKVFSINLPEKEFVSLVDYCGVFSGNDKTKANKFEYEMIEDVPVVTDMKINLICECVHEHQIESRVIMACKVLKTMIDEVLFKEQRLDLSKFKSLIYGLDNKYYIVGEEVGVGYKEFKKD